MIKKNRYSWLQTYIAENRNTWLVNGGQCFILFLVALLVLLPAPFQPNELFAATRTSDLIYSHWPFALLIQRTLERNSFPYWNPYFGGGQPIAGNPLAALFYPPTLLVRFLPLRDYFFVLIVGHLLFAGVGTLLLARYTLRLPPFAALVAAVAFMATPRLLSHLGAGHITVVQVVTWYPWLTLSCWATICKSWRWAGSLALCFGLVLLAGHPQMAYYGLLMTAGLIAWLLLRRMDGKRRLRILVVLGIAGIIGLLIASVHLLPLLELTTHSTRQEAVRTGDTFPILAFLHSLLFLPAYYGSPWEGIISPGPLVLLFALLGIVTRARKVWPFVLSLVLVALLAMGNSSYLYIAASYVLPELDFFRGTARIWFVGLLVLALLAGLGTNWLLELTASWVKARKFTVARQQIINNVLGLVVLIAIVCSLVFTDLGYTRTGNIQAVTTPDAVTLAASRLAGRGRVYDVQEGITQTNAVQLQMRLADGWDPLLLQNYVLYMQRAGGYHHTGYSLHVPYEAPDVQPNATLLGWMNVHTVVSRRLLTDPLLKLVQRVQETYIYQNTADAGAGYMVKPTSAGTVPDINTMQRVPGQVSLSSVSDQQNVFTLQSSASSYLVIATAAFPGWTATLDGHAVPVHLIAGVLPAISVLQGIHTVSYTYSPTYVLLGEILSATGILTVCAWILIGFYLSKRASRKMRQ